MFLLYTSELFSILENKLIGYADDSTLMAVVPSPGARVTVAESLSKIKRMEYTVSSIKLMPSEIKKMEYTVSSIKLMPSEVKKMEYTVSIIKLMPSKIKMMEYTVSIVSN